MFSINIAIVIGPTPFGTGVIKDVISFTLSKSTSPTKFPFSSLLIPTSITTAFSFINSFVKNLGFPIAKTKISAFYSKIRIPKNNYSKKNGFNKNVLQVFIQRKIYRIKSRNFSECAKTPQTS